MLILHRFYFRRVERRERTLIENHVTDTLDNFPYFENTRKTKMTLNNLFPCTQLSFYSSRVIYAPAAA